MQIQITGITQVPPITATTAKVKVSFTVSGGNFVQIYAAPAGGGVGSGELVATVSIVPKQTQYDQTVNLPAASFFAIYACPRTGSKTTPDDYTDGQPWDTYCAMQYFTTQGKETVPPSMPPPQIVEVIPQPASVNLGNSIKVIWSSTKSYDKYVVGWSQNGTQMAGVDINTGGTQGSWTTPTVPGSTYTFHVNGGVSQFWNYDYSTWGNLVTVVAGPNLTSVRKFLTWSGVHLGGNGLRSVVPSGFTLRKFMQLS